MATLGVVGVGGRRRGFEVVTGMEERDQVERNKAVIRRFVEEVQNGKDFGVYDELNDPEFVNLSSPPGVPADREGGKVFLQAFAQAYPDATFTIDDMIAEGDKVVTKKTMSGTNAGEFAGVPATGRRVTFQYVDIMRVRDGRIVEHWNILDQFSWLNQLGVLPAPSSVAAGTPAG
ncbi:ester cyclase [Kribbella sp. NPDC026611]|uniref:ester cyclase n=1 Tax=Kribbella sp. NPDC026611 TaxID=3154911 RepID=UPI0033F9D62A